jgi:LmbE family N-acetylglucosaminyl deacetylase
MQQQSSHLRVLCIGAHPDDCEIGFGGTAAKLAAGGHCVKFLSLTNGDAGHQFRGGAELASTRAEEAREAGRRLGIAGSEALPNRDGELLPSLAVRWEIVRQIRRWRADMVLTHRPCDYHPDHRYTSQAVQDSAYLVMVPRVCPDTPPLRENPVFLYLEDRFRKPLPFSPDLAVDVGPVWDQKIAALDAHGSQVYEWLPWVDGKAAEVPEQPGERLDWLARQWSRDISPAVREALQRRYGLEPARHVVHAEAFELCEYGRRISREELEEMLPR